MAAPDDSLEPTSGTPFRDLAALRREVDQLHQVVRLLLVGLLIATLGLCLFMYRQTQLLRYQIVAQQAAILRANQEEQPVLEILPVFQRLGGRFPDYANTVLAKYNLQPIPAPGSTPPAPAAAPPTPARTPPR